MLPVLIVHSPGMISIDAEQVPRSEVVFRTLLKSRLFARLQEAVGPERALDVLLGVAWNDAEETLS